MRMLPLLLALALVPAAAQTYTPETFRAELARLQASLDSAAPEDLAKSLPAGWDVQTPSKRYSVSAGRLRELLAPPPDPDSQPPSAEARRGQARTYLAELEQHVSAAARLRSENPARERATLASILARPEFQGVREPSPWDRFWARFYGWLNDLIQRVLDFAAQHPAGSEFIFWTVLTGSVALLGMWLFRIWTRGERLAPVPASTLVEPAARSWGEWLRDAREASRRGDLREAVRCAYWAGVARLQEERLLPARLSKTPRECVRLISGPQREPLRALTASLERFWYAGAGPAAADVETSFRHLESLGCKLD